MRRAVPCIVGAACLLWLGALPAPTLAEPATAGSDVVSCSSKIGERQQCPADTSAGVALVRSTGTTPCLLGKDLGLRRQRRVGGGRLRRRVRAGPDRPGRHGGAGTAGTRGPRSACCGCAAGQRTDPPGHRDLGRVRRPATAFSSAGTASGSCRISGYALVRYMNQMPAEQTFTDHLGNERAVDGRNDIFSAPGHDLLQGVARHPEADLQRSPSGPCNTTDQNAIFGNLGYQFSRKFSLYAGLNGNPGNALAPGLAPLLARPRSRDGRRVLPALLQLRRLGSGRSPCRASGTTPWSRNNNSIARRQGEPAGPEVHDRRARCGGCRRRRSSAPGAPTATGRCTRRWPPGSASPRRYSPEQRFTDSTGGRRQHHAQAGRQRERVRHGRAGARRHGADTVDYRILSFDAGMKYKGIFLQTEIYNRWLDNFEADGAAAGQRASTTRASTCRRRSTRCRRSSSSTPRPRRSSATRTPASATAPSTCVGMNFYPVRTPATTGSTSRSST